MRRLVAAIVAFAALASAGSAPAAVTGALKYVGCYESVVPVAGCAPAAGMVGPGEIAVSDDGANVYVAGFTGGSVAVFARDVATGALTWKQCLAGPSSSEAGCTKVPLSGGGATVSPFAGIKDVQVTHDGKNVYAVSSTTGSVLAFTRAAGTGQLAYKGCHTYSTSTTPVDCTKDLLGTRGAEALAIDGNDQSVYVAGYTVDIVGVLKRNPVDSNDVFGGLSQPAPPAGQPSPWCLQQTGTDDSGGAGKCIAAPLISRPHDLLVAPGGAHVYVANEGGTGAPTPAANNLAQFMRNTTTNVGILSGVVGSPPSRCVSETGTGVPGSDTTNCNKMARFRGVMQIAVNAEGTRIYGPARGSGLFPPADTAARAMLTIDRHPTSGALSAHAGEGACVANVSPVPAGCTFSDGMVESYDVVASPDGTSVFGTALFNHSITAFDVLANGGLVGKPKPFACVFGGSFADCQRLPFDVAMHSIAVSPDSRTVYAAVNGDDKLLAYAVDRPPVCSPLAASTAFNTAVTLSLTCSDPDGDANTFEIVSQPAKGQLGAIQGSRVTYGPLVGSSGDDTFAFRAVTPIVSDIAGSTKLLPADPATATVSVAAEPAPTPTPLPTATPTATPPPVITSEISTNWDASNRRFTKVLKLLVRNVPAGGSVQVICGGGKRRGCPFKSRKVTVKSGRADVRAVLKKARLKPKATLQIRITKPGSIGKVVIYTFRRRKLPTSRRLCLPVGVSRPQKSC